MWRRRGGPEEHLAGSVVVVVAGTGEAGLYRRLEVLRAGLLLALLVPLPKRRDVPPPPVLDHKTIEGEHRFGTARFPEFRISKI